ncbi:lysophospholipid acyltransferase family protein [candidate division KSB1 bacterium]|nr:lysophospholipid acyltransferase family protein [candidate division KSB1 bacterium]
MKNIQNYIEFFIVYIIAFFVRLLPRLCAAAFGRGLGLFIYYIIPIRKKVTLDNLSVSFPEKSTKNIRQIARRAYINFALNIIDFIRLPKASPNFFKKNVIFINAELFSRAHRGGKGAILLTGHFGNWELMAAAICNLGYSISAIVKEQRNKLVDKMINDIRKKNGVETLFLGMAIRNILRTLARNQFIALVADQDARKEGIFVDFLGRPSSTATGPAIFALKTGAPIIFGTAVREKNGKHTIYLQEINYSDLNGISEKNIRILTQRHATVLEKSVRSWPDHWFWMHKRWKTKPKVNADE